MEEPPLPSLPTKPSSVPLVVHGRHPPPHHSARPWLLEGSRGPEKGTSQDVDDRNQPHSRVPPPWLGTSGPDPHPNEHHPLKHSTGPRGGTAYPEKYRPYPVAQRTRFQFTASDIDRLLYGKQELKVVQIGDRRATPPIAPPGKPGGNQVVPEDKNKPAKWCDMCQEVRFGECPHHGPLPSLRPSITLPGPKSYAISTFPDEVGLCISMLPSAGYGVFARHFIPTGTWIGPYEGKQIPVEEGLKQISQGDAPFLWEIFDNLRLSHYLDASDENSSSWMRFIQCARHRGEQNLFVFQYYGSIYYRAFKDIPVGAELLVWYDEKYPQYFGIPYDIRDMAAMSMESIQAPPDMPKSDPESGSRPPHGDPTTLSGHAFFHGGKVISSTLPVSGHTRLPSGDNTSRLAASHSHAHGRPPHPHPHGSSHFQAPLPAQPPTLAPGALDTKTILSHSTAGRLHPVGAQHLPHGHSPRPMNPAFRRETPTSSSMLRSMSADDLRKHRIPQSAAERAAVERDIIERNLPPPPPPGLIAAHPNAPRGIHPSHPYNVPSVMSVSSLSQELMKADEMNKHNDHKLYLERERERAFERERLLREKDRLASRPGHERNMRDPPGAGWEIFHCKGCDHNFTQKSALEKHRCVSEASKPYQCGRCQLSFQELRDLQEHMAMHASERPFKCGVCSRSFSSTSSLSAHMRSHPTMGGDVNGASVVKQEPLKTLDCGKCGKRFQSITDMNKHLANPSECR